jgi:HIV Tat-specific factor 1
MFTLQELDEDPAAILDIKEDVREECSKFGEVTNVTLYDKEKDGVVSVRFTTPQFAMACVRVSQSPAALTRRYGSVPWCLQTVQALHGRNFSGLAVEAFIADGTEKYKKSSERKHVSLEDDEGEKEESKRRLAEFGSWLEKQEDGK